MRATEQPIDTSTPAGKAFLDMLGVFAEFETNLRRERQMEGIAKARGVYSGRKASISRADVAKGGVRGSGRGGVPRSLPLRYTRGGERASDEIAMCDRSPAAPGASHPGATRPVERTLRLVSGRWRLLIPFHLGSRGPTRQGALRRSLAPVTPRVLTRALRDLEADEPVWRRTEPTVPPVVTYGLTGRGHALAPVFEAMAAWGSDRSIPARLFGQVGVMVLMNRDAWDGLTDEQRAAIEEAATTLETQSVARFDELAAAEFEALKGLGMAETRFSDAEAERLEELWAEGVWSVASGAGDAAKALRETARGAGLTR